MGQIVIVTLYSPFLLGDLCPVSTMHKANGYKLQRHSNDMQNIVFENYDEQDAIQH